MYKYPEFDKYSSTFSDIIYNLFNTFPTDNILYICGDFNIDILHLNSPKVSHFIDILIAPDIHPLITKPSRITNMTQP